MGWHRELLIGFDLETTPETYRRKGASVGACSAYLDPRISVASQASRPTGRRGVPVHAVTGAAR